MKKLCLYLILFISLFAGVTSIVVYKGYSDYSKQETITPASTHDDSILTSLASGILQAENYNGEIELTSSNPANNISGTFNYINANGIAAQIILKGSINGFDLDAIITLDNNQTYININGIKLVCTTTDIVDIANTFVNILNNNSNSSFSEINLDSLTEALSDIALEPSGNGYCLNMSLPNLCDVYLATDSEYIPHQVVITNLSVGKDIYALNIKAEQTYAPMQIIEKSEYLNISSSLKYVTPIFNTISQGNIRLFGKLSINSTPLDINVFVTKDLLIQGDITYNNINAKFEFDGKYFTIKIFDYYFRVTPSELITTIKNTIGVDLSQGLEISDIDLVSLTKEINTTININNKNVIDNCFIDFKGITLDVIIGKTLYLPERLNATYFYTMADIQNLITYYKNIIANKYSIDVNANYNNITLNGKAYIEISENFSSINNVLFDGKINGTALSIYYLENETYLKIANNHIKVENGSWAKIISSIAELLNLNENDLTSVMGSNITQLLSATNITFNNKQLKITCGKSYINLTSFIKSYELDASYDNLKLTAKIYPGASEYGYILNSLEPAKYNDFSHAGDLITALNNTLNSSYLHYYGYLAINILDFTYKEIYVDLQADLSSKKIILTLDNLPLDSFVTYYSNLYYTNQKCVLTITSENINIYTTVTSRVFNKTTCVANKTIPLANFSLNELYDVFGMRKSLINLLSTNSTSSPSNLNTNLSTNCIKLLKSKLIFNYETQISKYIMSTNISFNYKNTITSATAKINISDLLYFNLTLYKY